MIENFLKQVYRNWVGNIHSVHSIFAEYYGEERVDLHISRTEEDWVQSMLSFDMRNLRVEGEETLLRINLLFRKVNEATQPIRIGVPEDLVLAQLTEEECAVLLQDILDSEYRSQITDSSSLSESYLLVLFPEVTVSNESDKSEVIYDTYIKVPINEEGCLDGDFYLCRSTFTSRQYNGGYMFSHTPAISNSRVPSFQSCCLGGGPIRNTISNLMGTYDPDIWLLFCVELEAYLRVESISGGPYIKLENIGRNRDTSKTESAFPSKIESIVPAIKIFSEYSRTKLKIIYEMMEGFLKYLVENKVLKFAYINGAYNIAHSYVEVRTLLSNAFIDYVNTLNLDEYVSVDYLFHKNILVKGIVKDNAIVVSSNNSSAASEQSGAFMSFRFKGNRVPFVVKQQTEVVDNTAIFLSNSVSHNLINHLLTYLNYGRTQSNTPITGNYYQ